MKEHNFAIKEAEEIIFNKERIRDFIRLEEKIYQYAAEHPSINTKDMFIVALSEIAENEVDRLVIAFYFGIKRGIRG